MLDYLHSNKKGFLKLPVAKNQLEKRINEIIEDNEDYLVYKYINKFPDILYVEEYQVEELNNMLLYLNSLSHKKRLMYMALYSYFQGDLGCVKYSMNNLNLVHLVKGKKHEDDFVYIKSLDISILVE